MKPEGRPVARRADYNVIRVPHSVAADLMAGHYAKGAANTSVYAHGLFRRKDRRPNLFGELEHAMGDIVGAAIWMPPSAGAAKWASQFAGEQGVSSGPNEVLALSRLFVAPGEPQNTAGLLLAASTRMVLDEGRYRVLVTYADMAQGHSGTVYKATGWLAAGLSVEKPIWLDKDGRQVSQISSYGRSETGRRMTTSSSATEMRERGFTLAGHSRKRRFVKFSR